MKSWGILQKKLSERRKNSNIFDKNEKILEALHNFGMKSIKLKFMTRTDKCRYNEMLGAPYYLWRGGMRKKIIAPMPTDILVPRKVL